MTQTTDTLEAYLTGMWENGKPVARLFKTPTNYYLYDTGTSKVLECEPHVYTLLDTLFKHEPGKGIIDYKSKYGNDLFMDAAALIKEAVENERILLSKGASQFGMGDHYGDIEKQISDSLGIITLEITENCNLRCEYCVYNPHVEHSRQHSAKEMSLETAFKAIDYLKSHSAEKKKVAVTFYGGEPLLRFDFIKQCVSYAQGIFEGKELRFSLTTNGTRITPEIARYFYENQFSVVVSIDGPREIHDTYRKDSHGNGSFDRAIKGLEMLVEQYREKASEYIMLSMVYMPPYSGKKINRISALWDEYPWIPKTMSVNMTYPSEGTLPPGKFSREDFEEDKELNTWGMENFEKKYMGEEPGHPISVSIEEKKLAVFMQRRIYPEGHDRYFLNGCCVPGVRKLFIAADGEFRVCEKISNKAPVIGNISTGIDIPAIKEIYIDGYGEKSLSACSKCWAIRLCSLCYIHGFDKGEVNMNTKRKACGAEQFLKERLLEMFARLTEKNPTGLDYLYEFKLE